MDHCFNLCAQIYAYLKFVLINNTQFCSLHMLANCSKCLRTYNTSKFNSVTLILCFYIFIVNPDGCGSYPAGLVAAATRVAFNMIPNIDFGSSLGHACNMG